MDSLSNLAQFFDRKPCYSTWDSEDQSESRNVLHCSGIGAHFGVFANTAMRYYCRMRGQKNFRFNLNKTVRRSIRGEDGVCSHSAIMPTAGETVHHHEIFEQSMISCDNEI